MKRKRKKLENNMRKMLCCLISSGVLIAALCISTHSNLFIANTVCLWLLGWIYLSGLCYCTAIKKDMQTGSMKMGAVSVIVSFILIMVFPIKYGDILTKNYQERQMLNTKTVTITPLQKVNPNATAAEIWIDKIYFNYQEYEKKNVRLSEGWQMLDNYIYCADARTARPLVLDIPQKSYFEIHFIMTEASGCLYYAADCSGTEIDLYHPVRKDKVAEPADIWGKVTEASGKERMLYYAAYGITLWIIIGILIRFIYCYYDAKRKNMDQIKER